MSATVLQDNPTSTQIPKYPILGYYLPHDKLRLVKVPYDIAYSEFRRLLKELREAKHLTQSEIARKLAVPQSFVSKYELGERRLDIIETAQVCEILGTSIPRFLSELWKRLDAAAEKTPETPVRRRA